MVERQIIESFVERVVAEFHPERVVLFGPYARGTPSGDSDVDLLVVMPHDGPPSIQAAKIRRRVRAGFPMDLIVRSPAEIRRRLAMGDFFVREILDQGQALYEGHHSRVA